MASNDPQPTDEAPDQPDEMLDETIALPMEETKRRHDPIDLSTGFERYEKPRLLGAGGVGTVRSFLDPNLVRRVAVKELHASLHGRCEQRTRFFREARVTARLQHPNIMPVYELGMTPQSNPYFTMKEITGSNTLQTVLNELRADKPEAKTKYTLSRLIDVFLDVCQAIAFAHSQGVIHRDLKPENILIGDFGEVLVTDWGLTKIIGEPEGALPLEDDATLSSDDISLANVTMDGSVSGTPLYMPPEQAMGLVTQLDHRSDIYSLGAILYELLTLQKVVAGDTLTDVLVNVSNGNIISPKRRTPDRKIACDLSAIAMHCLELKQDDRYQSTQGLIDDLKRYQQELPVSVRPYSSAEKFWKFCLRHPVLSASVTSALGLMLLLTSIGTFLRHQQYNHLMNLADKNRANGTVIYGKMSGMQTRLLELRQKRFDRERTAEEEALFKEHGELRNDAENAYRTAVTLYLQAVKGRNDQRLNDSLAEMFIVRLRHSLLGEDYRWSDRWITQLKYWLGDDLENVKPETRAEIQALMEQTKGDGTLALESTPGQARVTMQNLDRVASGSGVAASADMGQTPIASFTVPKGRYLLTFHRDGKPDIRYPMLMGHGEKKVITVPLPNQMPANTVYVPAGTFIAGGTYSRYFRQHEVYVDAFLIKQHEVSFAEYLEFWRAMGGSKADGRLMARVQLSQDTRQFVDAWDGSGALIAGFAPELPVVGITQQAAVAYCTWLSSKLGRIVRLPTAYEWEKAARGVDGRNYVWGNEFDASYAFTLENKLGHELYDYFAPPGSFPKDISIYGAYDLAGNVREWTSSPFPDGNQFFQIKGASAVTSKRFLHSANASDTPVVPTDVGFRYVMQLQDDKDF